jgi:ArsR family transcriptional regulator
MQQCPLDRRIVALAAVPTQGLRFASAGPLALHIAACGRHPADVDISTTVELDAARFRALGDPTRLHVIRELAKGTRCVCELRDHVGVPGPLLSHHLGVLKDACIVTAARRGRWIDYTHDHEALDRLIASLAPDPIGAGR